MGRWEILQLGGCPSESTSEAFRVCQKQVEANLFFWGSYPHFCLTSLLALQRRQKNKLSLLAAQSFYNTHHNGKHLLTYLPWLLRIWGPLMLARPITTSMSCQLWDLCVWFICLHPSFGPFYWISWHVGIFVNLIGLSGLILVGL
jgi:hypothetical protein